jgi:uncharacterized protein (UPF0332 family)
MASWTDMAAEALVAAKILRDAGQWRSAVSRAYYVRLARDAHAVFRLLEVPT